MSRPASARRRAPLVAAALGAVVACSGAAAACSGAGAPPPARPVAVTPAPRAAGAAARPGPPPPASLAAPADLAPTCGPDGPHVVLRGRVAVGARPEGRFDSWVDIEVEGARSDAAAVCARLVGREAGTVFPATTGLSAWTVRDCAAAPLPAAAGRGSATSVLVDRRATSALELLLAGAIDRCQVRRSERTRVATMRVSRFAGEAACAQARDRLQAARQRGAAAAERTASEWLRGQSRQAEAAVAQACAAAKEFAGLEVEQASLRRDVERACQGGQHSTACKRVTQRALALTLREVDAARARRACANARAMAEMLRGRLERLPSARDVPAPQCRPE